MARILVIDDDESNADVIKLILQQERHEVMDINTAKLIPFAIKRFHPDVIVMDILLDNGDGREICNLLKAKTKTRNIPVLLITAMLEQQATAKQSRADVLMYKPFDYTVLSRNVQDLVRKNVRGKNQLF
ncbi:MAG: response regulator transcription factor [Pedobacter sp.]|nr:MAG: response regulator transcription factor [Pedobacter sp.]